MNYKDFKSPSALFRPAPFWSWNDKLCTQELKRQIGEMADKGWGSYFMHSRVGLITGYLSDEWMEMIVACANKAKETNTYAWLYDEDKWPSGFAGGEVPLLNEDYRSRALVFVKKGEEKSYDNIIVEVEHLGKKYNICKRVVPLGDNWFNKTSYVDLMNPEAVAAFINATHERYKKTCGKYFGKEIPGIFTDEPCYLMHSQYDVLVVPWSDYLPNYFKEINGYKIENHIEELFLNTGDYKKVRYDFYLCATKLFLESFTKQYYKWCDENNLIMTGHYMCEDDIIKQTQWIGAAMPHYQFMHWPGIDKLSRNINQLVTVKQVTSVADQLGKERSFSEVFGCVGQQVSFYHRKWIADWQASLGISFVNHHLSLYSMRGERKRDYPANLFYQQPWWDEEKEFSDYIGRLSYIAASGKRKVDILVIHPIGTAWSELTPLDKKNNFSNLRSKYDRPFESLSKQLMANKLDFHYGDEIVMEENACVKNGRLKIGEFEYDSVVVPPCTMLSQNTIRLLNEFSRQAGSDRLIVLEGASPNGLLGGSKVAHIGKAISILNGYYTDRVKTVSRARGMNAVEIFAHVRELGKGKSILLSNTDKDKEVDATIIIPDATEIKVLDLTSGNAYKAPSYIEDGVVKIDILFHPAGSVVLLAENDLLVSDNVLSYLDSGVAFNQSKRIVELLDKWSVSVLEENVLVLDDVTLYMSGEKVLVNRPVSMAWHDYFYTAEDGREFVAEYQFEVEKLPEGEVFAAIELAENLDLITVNGNKVIPIKHKGDIDTFDSNKNWKDVSFSKVPITKQLKTGVNTLRLEGRKVNNIISPGCHIGVDNFKNYAPTEVEAVYIIGDFCVDSYDRQKFVMNAKKEVSNTYDITKDGYPFYAGKVKYSTKFNCENIDDKLFLKIDDSNCACARLFINGKDAGIKYWKPFLYDISKYLKEGENDIVLIISTTLFNTMGPNRISGILDKESVGPRTFIDHKNFTVKRVLSSIGLGKAYLLNRK